VEIIMILKATGFVGGFFRVGRFWPAVSQGGGEPFPRAVGALFS